MIDFKINNKGDLVLGKAQKFDGMRINFFASQFPAMRISFLQEEETSSVGVTGGQMRIRFNTSNNAFEKDKIACVAKTVEELKQRIVIALRTEYGDIVTKPGFGSTVYQLKHKDMYSKDIQQRLHDIVQKQCEKILDEPTVHVKAETYNGVFYCQNINIYIFERKKLLYKFSVMER